MNFLGAGAVQGDATESSKLGQSRCYKVTLLPEMQAAYNASVCLQYHGPLYAAATRCSITMRQLYSAMCADCMLDCVTCDTGINRSHPQSINYDEMFNRCEY